MTVRELMERVFVDSSEPSDLCPYTTPGDDTTFDITTAGAVKLLRLVNQAAVRIANWRFRDGRILHLHALESNAYFKNQAPITGTAISAGVGDIVIPLLASNEADQFNGWIIEITAGTGVGQVRLVTDTVVTGLSQTLSVDSPWDTALDATSEYSLVKSWFYLSSRTTPAIWSYHINLDPVNEIADIMRIRDVAQSVDLDRIYRTDSLTESLRTKGTPSTWTRYGNRVLFDAALEEERAYEMLYVRQPRTMTEADEVLDLPLQYHEAVATWATHNVHRSNQDFEGAYATKRELEDLMEMLRLQGSFDYDMDNQGIVVWG